MPRAERDTWIRTVTFVILGFICYALPWQVFAADSDAPVLRIQGSNTIGAKLGPALVKGLFEQQGLKDIRMEPTGNENEQRLSGKNANGRDISIVVAAHGSGTGFVALKDGSAELAASSRPIKDSEYLSLIHI